ncbi:MAG TPA: GIY-YIG nuclease family protein [Tepidisphaeraceae bacterium]|jgi:hypothetical protein
MDVIQYRNQQASRLPPETGVYALCDLDEVPIYVGQSTDGIRARVRRHLTSARSDVIANRQLDVWEVAYVWAWPVAAKRVVDEGGKKKITAEERDRIEAIERKLYHDYDSKSPLVNGTVVPRHSDAEAAGVVLPEKQRIQIMLDEEVAARKAPARRLPRQADHFRNLLDHMLNVKNEDELRRALRAHGQRLIKYYEAFLSATAGVNTSGENGESERE